MKNALKLVGIVKKFPHVTALDNVDFELNYGEIHALLGENGAGKTTLVNIISGVYIPDEGEIYLEGRRVIIRSPKDAQKLGIVSVSQHPVLIDSLTVLENIALALGKNPHDKKFQENIRKVVNEFNIKINLDAKIWQLSATEKARVEIVKALMKNGKIYIFDEPTSLVGLKDRDNIMNIMKKLRDEGKAVLFITHKVDEVFEIADRVTVLRKGKKVLTKDVKEITKDELIIAMFGRYSEDLEYSRCRRYSNGLTPILKVDNIKVKDDLGKIAVDNVSLEVYQGEIVGIAGPVGSGQRELLEAIAGIRKVVSGKVYMFNIDVTNRDSKFIRKLGVAYIPDDRLSIGSALSLTVRDNLIMRDLDIYTNRIGIYVKSRFRNLEHILSKVGLSKELLEVPCADLSGGMIQRVILARELLNRDIRLIVASYPTSGLDHETTKLVHDMFIKFRDRGCGVIIASEDIEELLRLCDRILVMINGKIVYESRVDSLDIEKLRELLST